MCEKAKKSKNDRNMLRNNRKKEIEYDTKKEKRKNKEKKEKIRYMFNQYTPKAILVNFFLPLVINIISMLNVCLCLHRRLKSLYNN